MSGNASLLLWVAATAVAFLGAYLFLGWTRRAQAPESGARLHAAQRLLAGAALGLGLSSAVILSLSAAGLPFVLGYRWLWVAPLVIGPGVACAVLAWWLSRSQGVVTLLAAGLVLAAVALLVQAGWMVAAGFRPGLRWQPALLGLAAGVGSLGFIGALWLANADASSDGARRSIWRLAAAALMTLTVVAGQEVLSAAAGVATQVGSVYVREAAASWLSLAAGGLVPALLGMAALDLALRNRADRSRRRRGSGSGSGSGSGTGNTAQLHMPQRRKRRRKYRAL